MQKQPEEPRSILIIADRAAYIDGQLMQLLVARRHALPAEYNVEAINRAIHLRRSLPGFCFNNIFCAATNFLPHRQLFCPIPETKKRWVMFLMLLLPVCFEQ